MNTSSFESDTSCESYQKLFGGLNFSLLEYPNEYTYEINTSDIIKAVVYIIFLVCSTFGNVGVLLIGAFNAHLRTAVNIYLLNLAVADLCIVVFCMWVHLVINVTSPIFVLGAFWCRFNGFAQMTSMTASVLSLVAIAYDRFRAVLFPIRVRSDSSRLRGWIISGAIWAVSVAVSVPMMLYRRLYRLEWEDLVETACLEHWPAKWSYDEALGHCVRVSPDYKRHYYLLVTVALFFAPVLFMGLVYSTIVWHLWISSSLMQSTESRVHVNNNGKKKVVKMVVAVMVVFVLCWLPLQVLILYGTLATNMLPDWFEHMQYSAYFIAYSNSLWNPLLYGGLSNGFRQGFKQLLRFRLPKVPTATLRTISETRYSMRLRMNRSGVNTRSTRV